MFGVELPTMLTDACRDAGGRGYLNNSLGKPVFSTTRDDTTVAIIEVNPDSDLSIPEECRQEMNEHNLVYTVVGKDKDHAQSYVPDRYFERVSYENRVYIYGMLDCYTLIREYYRKNYDVWIPANIERTYGWWMSGKNLYVDMYRPYGFTDVRDKIKKDDVLLFRFENGMPSHSAIYIGDGMMLHHMIGRFSCIEPFDGIYKVSLAGVLRYGV